MKKLLPRPCRGAVSLLARTPAEFDAGISSLYLDIALDGQIIYDPQDFGAQRFSFLRDLIRRKGLYRQRTPAGDLWRFRTLHTWGWELTWD